MVVASLNTFLPIIDLARKDLKECNDKRSSNIVLNRLEEFEQSLNTSALENGNKTMNTIREKLAMLDTEKYYRTADQRQFHQLMLAALAVYIYGKALEGNEIEVLEYNNFETLLHMVFLTMPRRSGKSECIYQMIAVLLLCCPGITMVAIAPSFRAAGDDLGLLSGVKRILREHFGVERFYQSRAEVIKYKVSATDIRTLCSYPGGAADK